MSATQKKLKLKSTEFLTDLNGKRVWVSKGDTIFFKDDIEMSDTVKGIKECGFKQYMIYTNAGHVALNEEFELLN